MHRNYSCMLTMLSSSDILHVISDADLLQKDLLDLQLWMEKWLLKLKTCKVVSYGHRLDFKNDYYLGLQSEGSISILEHIEYTHRVTIDTKLKFDYHINEKVNKSYSILGLIYRNFKYMLSDTFCI